MESIFSLLQFVMTIIKISRASGSACTLQTSTANPQLWKDGDIIIGGIFPLHSSWESTDLSYLVMPPPIKCLR